jgi:hypothetical protein
VLDIQISDPHGSSDDDEEAAEKKREQMQYRLTAVKGVSRLALAIRVVSWCLVTHDGLLSFLHPNPLLIHCEPQERARDITISGMYEDLATEEGNRFCCCCVRHHDFHCDLFMSAFLHWSFRSSFVVVFGSAAAAWLSMTTAFAVLIWIIGQVTPQCIGGVDFQTSPAGFLDAYQLSWTTFATVVCLILTRFALWMRQVLLSDPNRLPCEQQGYGLIYPATSATNTDTQKIGSCALITMLTAFESFVGVVYASLCAALMFAKVGRVQSFAQLTFSDPMVIRYGKALMTTDGSPDDDDYDDDDNCHTSGDGMIVMNDQRIPCPVLEFRIFNRLDSITGGEIMDATLNMTACIDVSQADALLMAQAGRRKKGKKGKKKGPSTRKRIDTSQLQTRASNSVRTDRSLPSESMESLEGKSENDSCSARDNLPSSMQDRLEPGIAQRHVSVAGRDAPLPIKKHAPRRADSGNLNLRTRYSLQPQQLTPTQTHGQSSTVRNRPLHHSNTSSMYFRSDGKRTSIMDRIRVSSFGWRREKQDSYNVFSGRNNSHHRDRSSLTNRNTQAFEEDPSGKILPTKLLTKLEVDSSDHPFFRRIWLVRHTLDCNSSLLKPHVRDLLRQHNGYWPKELNNYESIRASIGFDQILVSVSGTSNADANSVYAHHVYHMVDVNVGYRFVDALYRDHRSGSLRVDQSLINDVIEQDGGGGEPLNQFDGSNYQEIMVL